MPPVSATRPRALGLGSVPAAGARAPTLLDAAWSPASPVARAARAALAVTLGSLLLVASAKTKVPIGEVPMTLQTLAVIALGATLGPRLGVAAVLAYLAQGLAGWPVFTNTPPLAAGPAYFLGPTAGFMLGFIPAAWIAGLAAERGLDRSVLGFAPALVAAIAVVMGLGLLHLAFFAQLASGATGLGLATAFARGVQPFLLGEALKIGLVALAVPAVWSLLDRRSLGRR